MLSHAQDQQEKLSMKNMTSAAIRQSFLDFFESKGHLIVPSASLIPIDDPTLLFTNAGMNQFKDAFLGLASPPAPRVADTQKCMRVSGKHNDLEDVGPSPYHHTFFEMLGNWSFGDYYKKEAIVWAWELLTGVWGFPGERLYATVFKDEKGEIATDEEAVGYWQGVTAIEPDHVLFFGRKDNFWEMGETGPCGPCSEIHFDRGPEFCEMVDVPGHECRVNGDCDRFVELWNLVFIQYNSHGEGRLEPLPAQHVDTGAGFERLVMVMQGGRSNYDTDVFTPIFRRIQEMAGHSAQQVEQNTTPYRVIADHSRATAFLAGDGVLPGNVGRGYVLRMVIRRAARFGRKLGFNQPFMAGVAEAVIQSMGGHYRELRDRREHILRTITQEEERFLRTLDQGLSRLDQLISELPSGTTTLSGDDAFDLYATYGLPLEITRDVASEQGYSVDEDGFQRALKTHRDLSGGSMLEAYGTELAYYAELLNELKAEGKLEAEGVEHDPYGVTRMEVPIVALVRDGRRARAAQPGDEIEVVLPATPFYVEAGGQVSDTGFLTGSDTTRQQPAWKIRVMSMRQPVPGLVLHVGQVVEGQPREEDLAWAQIDVDRRMDIMRNHTATHLLHRGLRQVLGNHVQQAGSLVAPDRLRFDFTHDTMLTQEQLDEITHAVNDVILDNYPLHISHESYAQALEEGVVALFGEKYGDVVRVVRIGDADEFLSQELCGGTHVRETGDIGQFHIISESSVGAGLRRIEAVTGRIAERLVSDRLGVLERAAAHLECQPEEVDQKVLALMDQSHTAQREINRLRQELAHRDFEHLMSQIWELDGVAFLAARVKASQIDTLREMTDWFRDRYPSSVIVLGTVIDQRPQLVAAVTPDLVKRGVRANDLIKTAAHVIGGGGGGRPTLAQAGGRDVDRLDEALSGVLGLVQKALGDGE
jgi:alanyl-tRNA synthetase